MGGLHYNLYYLVTASSEPGGVAALVVAGHLLGPVLPLDEAPGLDAEIVKVLLVRVGVRVRVRVGVRVGVGGWNWGSGQS